MTGLPEWAPAASDLAAVDGVAAGSRVAAVAPFSHGPWWGFNGVQLIVVTDTRLEIVQTGFTLTAGRPRLTAPLSGVQEAGWRVRRGVGGQVVRLMFTVDGRRRRYVSKFQQAVDVCEALARATTGEQQRGLGGLVADVVPDGEVGPAAAAPGSASGARPAWRRPRGRRSSRPVR